MIQANKKVSTRTSKKEQHQPRDSFPSRYEVATFFGKEQSFGKPVIPCLSVHESDPKYHRHGLCTVLLMLETLKGNITGWCSSDVSYNCGNLFKLSLSQSLKMGTLC